MLSRYVDLWTYSFHTLITLAFDGGEQSVSDTNHSIPLRKIPWNPLNRRLVDIETSLDMVGIEKPLPMLVTK
jgi:hypothetical protein